MGILDPGWLKDPEKTARLTDESKLKRAFQESASIPVRCEALKRIRDSAFLYEVLAGLSGPVFIGHNSYAEIAIDTLSASDRPMLMKVSSELRGSVQSLAVGNLTDNEVLYMMREPGNPDLSAVIEKLGRRPVLRDIVMDPGISESRRATALRQIDDRELARGILGDPSNPSSLLSAAVGMLKDDPEVLLSVFRDIRYPEYIRLLILSYISLSEKELSDIVWDGSLGDDIRYAALGKIHDREELARIRDTIGDRALAGRACARLGHDYVTVSSTRTPYGTKVEKRRCTICGDETEGPVEWGSTDSV